MPCEMLTSSTIVLCEKLSGGKFACRQNASFALIYLSSLLKGSCPIPLLHLQNPYLFPMQLEQLNGFIRIAFF